MKILVIGNGGREHALAWKLAQDRANPAIYCTPGNAGTAKLGTNLHFAATDLDGIRNWCTRNRPGMVVIGPEAPLCAGLTDMLEMEDIRVFGPRKAAAKLEGSKLFAKEIMQSAGVPTAPYETFTDSQKACAYVRERGVPVVIKADGLASGKGVTVAETTEQAEEAIRRVLEGSTFGEAGRRIIIEDVLAGEEVSIQALVDGEHVAMLAASQDHKRAREGDKGPNTGGMGAYSPVSIVNTNIWKKVKEEIYGRMLTELKKRGIRYKGVLYAGLMIEHDKPSVVEFNCRFGDPEAQVMLTRWKGDILPVLNSVIDGNLSEDMVQWKEEYSVCVVMAAGGYPGSYAAGNEIEYIDRAEKRRDTLVFHAGTIELNKSGRVAAASGRVLGVTSLGRNLSEALSRAYGALEIIRFKDAFYRKDIAHREMKRLYELVENKGD